MKNRGPSDMSTMLVTNVDFELVLKVEFRVCIPPCNCTWNRSAMLRDMPTNSYWPLPKELSNFVYRRSSCSPVFLISPNVRPYIWFQEGDLSLVLTLVVLLPPVLLVLLLTVLPVLLLFPISVESVIRNGRATSTPPLSPVKRY